MPAITDSVQFVKGIGPKKVKLFEKLHISTLQDALETYPRDYEDRTQITRIADIADEDRYAVRAILGTEPKASPTAMSAAPAPAASRMRARWSRRCSVCKKQNRQNKTAVFVPIQRFFLLYIQSIAAPTRPASFPSEARTSSVFVSPRKVSFSMRLRSGASSFSP